MPLMWLWLLANSLDATAKIRSKIHRARRECKEDSRKWYDIGRTTSGEDAMMGRDHRKLTSGLPQLTWLRRGGLVVAALGSVLLALTGSLPVGQAADSAPPRYRIQWAPCPGLATTQCGTLRVPVDWSQPRGEQLSIAVARHPASDPGHRIGTLFFNPG